MSIYILYLDIEIFTQKFFLHRQSILSSFKTMQTAIKYFLVNTTLGDINTLIYIAFLIRKETVTFDVLKQNFYSS